MRLPRRRNYIVDKSLQIRLLLYNGIYFMIIVLAIGMALFLPLYFEFTDPNLTSDQLVDVAGRVLYLHNKLWTVILAVFIILGIHSILVSHRIAGPLYRFRMTFQDIIDGNISRFIRIRKGDYLVGEQAKIEEMVQMLRSKLNVIKGEQADIERLVDEILKNPLLEREKDLKAKVGQLEIHNSRLGQEIAYFQLPPNAGDGEQDATAKGNWEFKVGDTQS
ncbi:MAG: hypothetical protein KKE57_07095 [Proteobacteria bacterium]|nr:hypothetical protein [Pseudomonadota bacterium]